MRSQRKQKEMFFFFFYQPLNKKIKNPSPQVEHAPKMIKETQTQTRVVYVSSKNKIKNNYLKSKTHKLSSWSIIQKIML